MKQLNTITLLIILLLVFTYSKAQYNFRSLDIRSGLSDNFVRTILKDQKGFLWFGTLNGLTRYDGFHNRPYALTTKNGKDNNNVLLIQQDKSGQTWVTTYDGSLFCYNTTKDCMEDNASEYLATLGINLKQDKTSQGKSEKLCIDQDKNLWFIQGKSIFYYLFDAHRLYQMSLSEAPTWITCRGGLAFALTKQGNIYRINPVQKSTYLTTTYPKAAQDLCIYQDTRNNLWIYDKYGNGLYKKSLSNDKLEQVNNENVTSISEDNQGNLWIGTNSNGIIVQPPYGLTTHITRNESTPYPLTSNHISTIEIDEDNMAWIGTSKLGIAYTYLNNTSISVIPTPFNEDIGFLSQDANGKLWIGYDGQGLYDATTRKHYNTSNSLLASNIVIGGKMANDNRMYLGTYGGGIYCLSSDNKLTRIWQKYPQLKYARRIIQDKRGNFWIGATMNGLCLISPNGKLHNYTYQNSDLRTNAITDMAYSEKEDLLFVATGTGLYTVDSKKRIKAVGGKDLQNATINVIYIDPRGLRWVCTNEEVNVYDSHLHLLKAFGKAEGLNNALAITSDQQGQIWLTTSDAIHTFVIEKKGKEKYAFHFRKFTNADGLGDITFCKKAIYCMKNGDILAGGCGKYARLTPSKLGETVKIKNVIFTELRVGEEVLPFSTDHKKTLSFKYGEDFSLYVSTLDYSHAAPTKFAYQLNGKGEWIPIDDNCIKLANLSFGKYTLQVKALDGNDDTDASISFTIAPPFWLSRYAICTYLLLLIILIGVSIKYYKQKTVNEKAKKITSPETENQQSTSNFRLETTEKASRTAEQELIEHATKVIEKHLDETEFSVEDFSMEMNLSRSALYKKLMAATEKSPLEFMRAIRLRHGMSMLQQDNLSVSEIAYSIGLSPKQFSKFFKEEYGVLPSQYKKQEASL